MQKREKDALSRRAFVGKIATTSAAGVVALAVTGQRSQAALHHESSGTDTVSAEIETDVETDVVETPQAVSETAPPPWDVLKPLTAGASVAAGWQLSELSGVIDGACVVTLANRKGRTQRLHICRNDGRPSGLVYTDRFDLVVMNGGRGDLPTEENFGQAVAEIAHVIAGNEAKHDELMRTLLPQSEREQKFAATARLR